MLRSAKKMKKKWGSRYNPLPEAVELVDIMLNKCKLKRLNKKYIRVTIHEFICVLNWPEDPLDDVIDIPRLVDCLLFYHRETFQGEDDLALMTDIEKCLLTTGFEFVAKYLDKYDKGYPDRAELYGDYYDR